MRLQIIDITVIKWWVDASGRCAIIRTSTKQKLNTRSSTETELVGADDVMYITIWTKYFIEAQGYKVKKLIPYQDNKSCILLEKNGRASSSKIKNT